MISEPTHEQHYLALRGRRRVAPPLHLLNYAEFQDEVESIREVNVLQCEQEGTPAYHVLKQRAFTRE